MTDDSTIYIRPSTVQSAMHCGGRPGLRGLDGYNYQPNEALMFGSLVHWMIEQHLKDQLFTADTAEFELHDLFVKDVPEGVEATPFANVTTKKQRQLMAQEASLAYSLWVTQVLPSLPDEAPVVEEPLEMHVGWSLDHEIKLRGTPDAVYPNAGIMVDWKTAGRAWSAEKATGQMQRVCYPMMYNDSQPEDVTKIHRFDYWVFDRSAQWWNRYPTKIGTPEAERAFRRLADSVAIQLESSTWNYTMGGAGGGFKPRGFLCNPQYCDAWAVCDGKFLVADGLAEQPALSLKERWA